MNQPDSGAATTAALLTTSGAMSALDFGRHAVGSSTDRVVTITNAGGQTARALSATGLTAPFDWKAGAFPGAGGSCAQTLEAGASCTLWLRFAPTSTDQSTASLALAYDDGTQMQTLALELSGTGVAAAALRFSDGPSYDYGTQPQGAERDHSFVLTNDGGSDATQLGAPSADGAFSVKSTTCASSLASLQSCEIVVTFTASSGSAHGALSVTYDDGTAAGPNQMASVALAGLAADAVAPALLSLDAGSAYDFGTRVDGSSTTQVFTVTNSGGVSADLSWSALDAPFGWAGGAFPGSGGSCGATLAAGQSCSVEVAFSPSGSGANSYAGSLEVTYTTGVGTASVMLGLGGSAEPPAALVVQPSSPFDFGSVAMGATSSQVFTVQNVGSAPALLGAAAATLDQSSADFHLTADSCSSGTLAANASCSLTVSFAPALQTGATATAALSIAYDNGLAPTLATLQLSGTGVAPALLSVSPATYDYSTQAVGSVTAKVFDVTYSGGLPASNVTPSLPAGYQLDANASSCSNTISSSCTWVVSFVPGSIGTTYAGSFSLAYDDGTPTSAATSAAISGTGGTPASLSLSDAPSYDFGTVRVNGTADHVFYLTNQGELSADSITPSAFSGTFFVWKNGPFPGFGGDCGASLPGGASCKLVLSYTPTAAGNDADTLALTYDSQLAAGSVSVAVSGTGTHRAFLQISDFPLEYYATYGLQPDAPQFDYGAIGVGQSAEHTFSVTNTGAAAATLALPPALSGAFAWKGAASAYPGAGGSCGSSLQAGASCVVVVSFSPAASQQYAASFSLSYDDGQGSQSATRDLSGSGIDAAQLVLRDFPEGDLGPVWDYGLVGVGNSAEQQFYLINEGNQLATSISFDTGSSAFTADGSQCGTQLEPGASCWVPVRFSPAAEGPLSAELDAHYESGASTAPPPATRALKGVGTKAAVLVIDADNGPTNTYDFGTHGVDSSSERSFSLLNYGGSEASGIGFPAVGAAFAAGQPFYYQPGTCGGALAAGARCSFTVVYAPGGIAGASAATLSILYSDGLTARTSTYNVTGAATGSALLSVREQASGSDPATGPFDYGLQGVPTPQLFLVSNDGGAAATGLSGSIGGLFSFPGGFPGTGLTLGGNCPAGGSLAAGASCSVLVLFSPSGSQISSSTLQISYVDAATSSAGSASRDLTGSSTQAPIIKLQQNGFCPSCPSDLGTYSYGTTGVTKDATFYLENVGVSSATSFSVSTAQGTAFTLKGSDCGSSLAGNDGRCSVTVSYTPSTTTAAPQSDTLLIAYDDGSGIQTITKGLTGTATLSPLLQLSCPGCSEQGYDFGTRALPTVHTFYVSNVGGADATSLEGAAFSDPAFSFPDGFSGLPPSQSGACVAGQTLYRGASCALAVQFAPGLDALQHSSLLGLSYDAGTSAGYPVFGQDTDQPLLEISDWPLGSGGGGSGSAGGGGTGSGWTTSPFDFGTTGVPLTHTFYLTNLGTAAQNLQLSFAQADATFGFAPSSDPDACQNGASLASGQSCTLAVTFTPAIDTSVHASAIAVGYTGGGPVTRQIQGTDTDQPVLTVFDCPGCGGGVSSNSTQTPSAAYDFGTVASSRTNTFVIENTGGAPATLSGSLTEPSGSTFAYYSFAGAGAFPGQGGSCSTAADGLAPGDSCTVVVSFNRNPADAATHSEAGALVLGSPLVSRQLVGTEVTGALLSISDCEQCGGAGPTQPPFDYGVWGVEVSHLFYVTNTGNVETLLSANGFSGASSSFEYSGGSFPGQSGSCTTTTPLQPGDSCTVEVKFKPALGPFTAPPTAVAADLVLGFTQSALSASTASRSLLGEPTASANLVITDYGRYDAGALQTQPYDYGVIGTSIAHVFTVTNSGAADATVTTPTPIDASGFYSYTTSGLFPGAGGTCSNTIAAGASCTISVTFAPTAPPLSDGQTAGGTISLSYTGGTAPASPAERSLAGTFTTQPLVAIADCAQCGAANPGPYDYGHWGITQPHVFTVRNDGGSAAPVFTTSPVGSYFFYTGSGFPGTNGSCPTTSGLGAGQTCTIEVAFDPSGAPQGSQGGTIALGYGSQSAVREVTGTAEPGVYLVLAANSAGWQPQTFDYGAFGANVATAALRQNGFYVFNKGGTATTISGALSGPFSFPTGSFPGVTGGDGCSGPIGGPSDPGSCQVRVEFDPAVVTTPQTGSLSVSDGTYSAMQQLSGEYSAAAYIMVDANGAPAGVCGDACGPDYFGSYPAGTTVDRSYWVTNTGDAGTGSLSEVLAFAAPFQPTPSVPPSECTSVQISNGLSPGEQCTITVEFAAPADAGGLSYSGAVGVSAGGVSYTRSFQASVQ